MVDLIGAPLTLITPGTYTIQVQGRLDAVWAGHFSGMHMTIFGDGRHTVTLLVGRLADQAALFGVLNTLYELGMPILSVEYVPPP